MNEHAKEVLAQLLQRVLDGVNSAVEFSQQEIPEVIEQLLIWHFVDSAISMILSTCMWLALIYLWVRWIKYTRSEDFDEELHSPYWVLVGLFSTIWLAASCSIADLAWLKIWITPKLYLLEYGATLIK